MTRRFALLLLLASRVAFAHGGLEHVMGTVARITATSLDVKTVAGKTTTVTLDAATRWVRGTAAVTPQEVKPGDRVVIHAKAAGVKLTAVEVAVGTTPASH